MEKGVTKRDSCADFMVQLGSSSVKVACCGENNPLVVGSREGTCRERGDRMLVRVTEREL